MARDQVETDVRAQPHDPQDQKPKESGGQRRTDLALSFDRLGLSAGVLTSHCASAAVSLAVVGWLVADRPFPSAGAAEMALLLWDGAREMNLPRTVGTHNVAISSNNESSAKTPANAREDTPKRADAEAPRAGVPEHPNAHEDTPRRTGAATSGTRDAPAPGPSETPSEA